MPATVTGSVSSSWRARSEVSPQMWSLENRHSTRRSAASSSPGYSTPGCHSTLPTIKVDTQVPSTGAWAVCVSLRKLTQVSGLWLAKPAGGLSCSRPPRGCTEGVEEVRSCAGAQHRGSVASEVVVSSGSVVPEEAGPVVTDSEVAAPPPTGPLVE